MDALLLSRLQFAVTAAAHFIFPSFTIGLSVLIFVYFLLAMIKKDETYRGIANFFVKIFAVGFAIGVATGVVMELQFGANWARFSEKVGAIFGGPLAAESTLAFFLESVFLAVLVFGEKRISPGLRTLSAFLVMFGTVLSAFWILTVLNWMQIPVGYEIEGEKIVPKDYIAIMFNTPNIIRYIHTLLSTFIASSTLVMAICAYKFLKRSQMEVFSKAFGVASWFFTVPAVLQIIFGTLSGEYVAKHQPLKLAMMEAQWETQKRAPERIVAFIDQENMENTFEIGIPGLLSLLAYRNVDAEVKGVKELISELQLGEEELPSINLIFWSFRVMVGLGFLFVLVGILTVAFHRSGRLLNTRWFLKFLLYMIPLPIVANLTGWIVTEVGRQPWTVYGILKTADSVSHISAAEALFSFLAFSSLYLLLVTVWGFVVAKIAKGEVKI